MMSHNEKDKINQVEANLRNSMSSNEKDKKLG